PRDEAADRVHGPATPEVEDAAAPGGRGGRGRRRALPLSGGRAGRAARRVAMISRIRGVLLRRDAGTVEIMTAGGVAYEIEVPLTVYERLPGEGADVELRTMQVVREDAVALYGFLDELDRRVFARLIRATGVGPKLALNMLSTMPANRLLRAILERDIASLRRIPGFGAKKAERLAVEMTDRLDDLAAIAAAAAAGAD